MRKAYFLLLLAPTAIIWACGGTDSTIDGGNPDATTDSTTGDSSPPGDSSTNDANKNDGGPSDASQDLNIKITCQKPADCFDGGNPDAAYPPDSGEVCCGTVQTAGQFPNCSFNSASTTCDAPSACATKIGLQSCGTDTVRLCSADSECTEQGGQSFTTYTKCCSTQYQDAGRVHFCANTTIAAASQGAITCP